MLYSCCLTRRDPSVQMHVPLSLSHRRDKYTALALLLNSGPAGNQPLLFPGFHPHCAEGGQGRHRGRRLHRPVPGKDGSFSPGKFTKRIEVLPTYTNTSPGEARKLCSPAPCVCLVRAFSLGGKVRHGVFPC